MELTKHENEFVINIKKVGNKWKAYMIGNQTLSYGHYPHEGRYNIDSYEEKVFLEEGPSGCVHFDLGRVSFLVDKDKLIKMENQNG